MAIAIIYSEELREYDFGPGHPFRGDRYEIFPRFLRENLPEDDNYRFLKAEPCTDEDLLLICDRDYIDFTRGYFKAASLGSSHSGNFFQYHSGDNMPTGRPGKIEEAARLMVGQVKMAAAHLCLVGGGVGFLSAFSGNQRCHCLSNESTLLTLTSSSGYTYAQYTEG